MMLKGKKKIQNFVLMATNSVEVKHFPSEPTLHDTEVRREDSHQKCSLWEWHRNGALHLSKKCISKAASPPVSGYYQPCQINPSLSNQSPEKTKLASLSRHPCFKESLQFACLPDNLSYPCCYTQIRTHSSPGADHIACESKPPFLAQVLTSFP